MIIFLAGVAAGFFLVGVYGLCVREWEHRPVFKWDMEEDFSGRVVPWYVRAWQLLFE